MKRILISGGAGFIGVALVRHIDALGGYDVTVLDSLIPQIHGAEAEFSEELRGAAACIKGDVRDSGVWKKLLPGMDVVVHLAAETGTGQSMYEIERYISVNVGGTALMLEACDEWGDSVQRVVLASSRAIYGEGKYNCSLCGVVYPTTRDIQVLKAGDFGVHCPGCGGEVDVLATDEGTPMKPASVYGVSKAAQEQLVTVWGESRSIETVALRFQNVYGPGQALSNPYTGILSIFSNLILGGRPIDIYEDGEESRDFIYIDDVVGAIRHAIEAGTVPRRAYNVGTGIAVSVAEVAELLMEVHGLRVPATVSGHFRAGDIRHNFAEPEKLREDLGFSPECGLRAGLEKLVRCVKSVEGGAPDLTRAETELESRGLLHTANGRNSK